MRLLLILLLTLNLLNAKKIALLIGNSDYSFQPLKNPLHDVDGIYKTLKEIGFKESNIKVLKNASKTTMENALANFAQRATTAEIALIYFSGHGMQVNNINYMFPARTTAKKPIHLRGLVDLNYFIESATSAKYGIVLVDACRNNPLVKYFQNGKHKGATAKKGLGQVTPTAGQVVIGFATSAGDTADDGNGDMSPYAKALSVRLKESDDIRNVLGKVGNDVSKKYEQNPIYRSNLADSVFLHTNKLNKQGKETITKPMVSNLKWVTIKDDVCKANGGKVLDYEKYTVCQATWKNGKKICSASGGKLASIDDFRELVTDCGGVVSTNKDTEDYQLRSWTKNENTSYRNCLKKNKFSIMKYWTSDTPYYFNPNANSINLSMGYISLDDANGELYIRCIK